MSASLEAIERSGLTPEDIDRVRHQLGLDDPLPYFLTDGRVADRGSLEIFGNSGRVALSVAVIPSIL